MTMLDPIATANEIDAAYLGYLKSTFGPRRADLRADFERELEESKLVSKGPYLQATAPFVAGRGVDELVAGGVLTDRFADLASSFPLARPLHLHQEQAIEKAVGLRRNLVVSTGTGSGKTESFLLPVVDHLLRQRERGELERPGVRALLLYPMNALANDQLKRLRELLAPVPDVTFGRYTGETKSNQRDAEDDFRQRHPGAELLTNELISREVMQERPPHILLTNYAMLEYLLLRPDDTPLFDGAHAQDWRFVVLDEAHVYNGAQGTEIAYLLRRLRDRVVRSERGRLQCFALSATLGRGEEDHPALVQFATDLFDESFEWVAADPSRCDVVTATRIPPTSLASATGELTVEQIDALHGAFRGGADPDGLVASVGVTIPTEGLDASATLHALLETDANLLRITALLEGRSVAAVELASEVFPGSGTPEHTLTQFVDLAVNARRKPDDAPLLPARYHHFLRSLEGAFCCLHPDHPVGESRVSLVRLNACEHCRSRGVESRLFELAICRTCRVEYVVGVPEVRSGSVEALARANDFDPKRRYYLLGGETAEGDDDDEQVVVDLNGEEVVPAVAAGQLELCAGCGGVVVPGEPCSCGSGRARTTVTAVEPPRGSRGEIRSCVTCSSRRGQEALSRFVTGTDAPVTVIATGLYQQLPVSTDPGAADQTGEGRKLLTFSDSRQDAAFFAGYLDRTYGRALHRSLILEAVERSADPLRTADVVERVLRLAEENLVLDPDAGRVTNQREVSHWVTEEVLALDRRQSLEGVGLSRISVAWPRKYRTPEALLELGLGPDAADGLVQLLLGTLRASGSVTMLDGVDVRDDRFAPRNHSISVRGQGGDSRVLGWQPAGPASNRRLDLLTKVVQSTGANVDPGDLLARTWAYLTDPAGPWSRVFVGGSNRRDGQTWQLNIEAFEFQSVADVGPPLRCDRCGQLIWWSVAGVCPGWRCDGVVRPVADIDALEREHYAQLYRGLDPIALTAEEHTAQWTAIEAASVQDRFIAGDVNVLSCSTTFEMGVDVGDLQAVLLRNVPPAVANYVQRAGRAGRRTDAAALVVTFAQRRNHDRSFYDRPTSLIDGHIVPPAILTDNAYIARRHVHSVAFARFLREVADRGDEVPEKVGGFFALPGEERSSVADEFESWLRSRPAELGDALDRLLPQPIQTRLGVREWEWVPALLEPNRPDPSEGWFARARAEVESNLERLAELRRDAAERQSAGELGRFQKLDWTIRKEPLISFLSSSNVLPKYGFPVDVVGLDLQWSGHAMAGKLELSRDLRLAIVDYAPGAQVVAGKHRWQSIGVSIRADQTWPTFGWAVCDNCSAFRHALAERPATCHVCGSAQVAPGSAGEFIIPIFGLRGSEVGQSGENKPQRKGFADSYFSTDELAEFELVEGLPDDSGLLTRMSRQGRITVINSNGGGGFRLCDWCGGVADQGRGESREHRDPRFAGRKCNGPLRSRHLGHRFLTDVLELKFAGSFQSPTAQATLYALIESAGSLGISGEELDGTTYVFAHDRTPALVLYDAVPGGAGHCQRLRHRLPDLLDAAYDRVAECSCDVDASCYSCLRSYRNQRIHEQLRRSDALSMLGAVLGR